MCRFSQATLRTVEIRTAKNKFVQNAFIIPSPKLRFRAVAPKVTLPVRSAESRGRRGRCAERRSLGEVAVAAGVATQDSHSACNIAAASIFEDSRRRNSKIRIVQEDEQYSRRFGLASPGGGTSSLRRGVRRGLSRGRRRRGGGRRRRSL